MRNHLFIKLCGLKTEEDVDTAAEVGADAIGFMFADSPRRVDATTAIRLIERIPSHVMTVGVFRNQPVDYIRSLANITGIGAVQLHGNEERGHFAALRDGSWTLIRGASYREPVPQCGQMGEDILLLDAPTPGAGITWDWTRKAFRSPGDEWLLAGGLTPDNVAEAVEITRPWGVDVSSGIESVRGVKDSGLIRAFVKAARAVA
ncbi:phosphoribosylanthranilate isomerase [Streptomyces sp. HUCO-GS316]|uniref:phosphoribosylanthranilate isomerase n=1 Tax=Streptomyces sp. HUCO-GS316 TaxID=2692198 RepID=UPI001368A13B|nr:phosphoribosylanthranilate isomerase [Streptomyces sp. HUCO-GS316]MXM66865.1 phosphoribosylanthranilate isomerase [Streptomyces sp. HUCO-GS316]